MPQKRLASLRFAWSGGAVLAVMLLQGCTRSQSSLSAGDSVSTTEVTTTTTQNSLVPDASRDTVAAPPVSLEDPVALWADVRAQEAHLASAATSLEFVRAASSAHAILDRVNALDEHHGTKARDSEALTRSMAALHETVEHIDECVSLRDATKLKSDAASLQATLRAIENAFPPGLLGTS